MIYMALQWRYWWIESVKERFPEVYEHATIHQPPSLFIDKSYERKKWKEDIESYMLSRLASSCDRF